MFGVAVFYIFLFSIFFFTAFQAAVYDVRFIRQFKNKGNI
jgi:hypothetical protein